MICRLPRPTSPVRLSILGAALLAAACSSDGGASTVPSGSGGRGGGTGGSPGSGGSASSGGSLASGGTTDTGGSMSSGGRPGSGGAGVSGGTTSSGGSSATGGTSAVGGTTAAGGTVGSGGSTSGGTAGVGGGSGSGGVAGTTAKGGATTATGGAGGSSTGTSPTGGSTGQVDCSATMPSGGTTHCGSYKTGKAGNLSWELWSNSYNSNACITYFSTPAFSAKWNNNSDYLARLGIEWGGKAIAQLGDITAEFTYKKTGTAGGYSYIGVYGWATNPCVEYYIIDDSYGAMPFNPWNMQGKGSATIDGEVYKFFSGTTNGTGGSRCNGGGSFQQYWSVRQKARQCGVMTISQHFAEWKKVGMNMDNILEAKILVETGGGSGTIDFPVANVKSSK